jgi:hypothetical protein
VVSEVGEEMGDDFAEMNDSLSSLVMPDFETVKPEDGRFPSYVDDSMEILDSMIRDWGNRILQLQKDDAPKYALGKDGKFQSKDDKIARLKSELERILERKEEFVDQGVRLVNILMPYEPEHGSRYVHMFFDRGDGTCEYRRFDIFEKEVEHYKSLEGGVASFDEVWSVEGTRRIRQNFGDNPICLVQCPIENLHFDDLLDQVCLSMEGYMALQFPDFYEQHGVAMDFPKFLGVHIYEEGMGESGEPELMPAKTVQIDVKVKVDLEMMGYAGTERRFEAATGEIKPQDPRLN